MERSLTPLLTLRRAYELGLKEGLRNVYEGNVPGEGCENTYCYACGAVLIERYNLTLEQNRLKDGKFPDCGATIDGISM